MRVIVPMSGAGERFKRTGYDLPKPLIKVDNRSILAHLLEKFPREWPKTYICSEVQLKDTEIRKEILSLDSAATIVGIPPHKKGPVWAVLEGLRVAPDCVAPKEPCLVNYCDFSFVWDPWRFEAFSKSTACEGAVVCYTGFHPEYVRPALYAYCREEEGRLLEIREKHHFTEDRTKEFASSGTYYFKSANLMKESFAQYFEKASSQKTLIHGEGYVSEVYNELIDGGCDIRIYEIPYFLQWGTPEDLKDYQYWHNVFANYVKKKRPKEASVDQLLMPMAGRGSRFEGTLAKPLIQVMGRPMFLSAKETLPKTDSEVYVIQKSHESAIRPLVPQAKLLSLEGVTEGQAITCELARSYLDLEKSLLVSSCDHGIQWDSERWTHLLAEAPDLVVFGQRNYPGADVDSKAYAYIELGEKNNIQSVSVKRPISENPRSDLVLMGTFYFAKAALMFELIEILKQQDVRVNGEFYLDSVVNLAVAKGLKVLCFETEGYLCWGTPDALKVFNYWYHYFTGKERGSYE